MRTSMDYVNTFYYDDLMDDIRQSKLLANKGELSLLTLFLYSFVMNWSYGHSWSLHYVYEFDM